MLKTAKVPEQFAPIFKKAQDYVSKFFKGKNEDPSKGTIEIFGERYILVRAASLSVDFFETIRHLYEKEGKEEALNIARQLLFDIAHAIGKQDAKNFHEKMKLEDPIEKLSAGPIHFSHSGWAFVDILPESRPSPDENFYLIYDHPYSFESSAWLESGKRSDFPVCVMNSGYSSGWCQESFGITLVASEILCQAKGDHCCRFIMAPPSKLETHIVDYLKKDPQLAKKISNYEIPGFFKKKEIEEELHESEEKFRMISELAQDAIIMMDANGLVSYWNRTAELLFGYVSEEIMGKELHAVLAPECYHAAYRIGMETFKATGHGSALGGTIELVGLKKGGIEIPVELSLSAVKLRGKWNAIGVVRDITKRKDMEAQLKDLSNRDELTGLYNRRGFIELIEQQIKVAGRMKFGMHLLFADLDDLKEINDTYGHQEGDRALIEIANLLTETFRASDIVARIGGDEFVALAMKTQEEHAEILETRFNKSISVRNEKGDLPYALSLSIGITYCAPEQTASIENLIAEGDRLMYEAKRNKRKMSNRITVKHRGYHATT